MTADRSPHARFHPLRLALAVAIAALLLLAGSGPAAPPTPSRIVAVADVHGDIDSLRLILREAGLLNENDGWAGGTATLVQTGDLLDRGADDRAVLELMMQLEREASRAGGRVVALLGNHEVMNLLGDLRYVAAASYADFADRNAERRRQNGWRDLVRHIRQRTSRGAEPALPDEAEWLAARPPGYFEHREAFSPRGRYGRWLRGLPAVVEIDGTIFLHGGISPALAEVGIEAINRQVRDEITFWDNAREFMLAQRQILPFFDMKETLEAAAARREELRSGRLRPPMSPEEAEMRQAELAQTEQLANSGNWYVNHPDGPLWFRGYATWPEQAGAAEIEGILGKLGARRIVVGHTVQPQGRIGVRFDGRVILIDTGMLSTYYQGGRPSALEIAGERITAIYPGERVVLSAAAAVHPASGEDREQFYGGGGAEPAPPRQAPAAEPIFHRKTVWLDPDGNPLPWTNDEEVMDFLRRARVRRVERVGEGITQPNKVLLERDGLQMHAIHRHLDVERPVSRLGDGSLQLGFRDSFYFELAAYEMARLLGLDMVPPVVRRTIQGQTGSLQAWVEKSFHERHRRERNLQPPDQEAWGRQIAIMRVFDALVGNVDRNLGNILYGEDWRLWMIDHTRAFSRSEDLPAPQVLSRIERRLWKRLLEIDARTLRDTVGRAIRPLELRALEVRLRKLVEHFQALIAQHGEEAVLYSLE